MKMFKAPRPQVTTQVNIQVTTDDLADINEKLKKPRQTVEELTTKFPNNANNANNQQALALLNSLTETFKTIINGASNRTEPSPPYENLKEMKL